MYCRYLLKTRNSITNITIHDFGEEIYVHFKGGKPLPKSESGIHRICKISPYDKQKRRYTNFVEISVDGQKPITIVRSYLFDPIKLVRNIRDSKKTNKIEEVLAGNLDLLL